MVEIMEQIKKEKTTTQIISEMKKEYHEQNINTIFNLKNYKDFSNYAKNYKNAHAFDKNYTNISNQLKLFIKSAVEKNTSNFEIKNFLSIASNILTSEYYNKLDEIVNANILDFKKKISNFFEKMQTFYINENKVVNDYNVNVNLCYDMKLKSNYNTFKNFFLYIFASNKMATLVKPIKKEKAKKTIKK